MYGPHFHTVADAVADPSGIHAVARDAVAERDHLRVRARDLAAAVERRDGRIDRLAREVAALRDASQQADVQLADLRRRAADRGELLVVFERAVEDYARALAGRDLAVLALSAELADATAQAADAHRLLDGCAADWRAENTGRLVAEARALEMEAENGRLTEWVAEARLVNTQLTHDLTAGARPTRVTAGPN